METVARTIVLQLTDARRRATLAEHLCATGWQVAETLDSPALVVVTDREVPPDTHFDVGLIHLAVETNATTATQIATLPPDASLGEIVRTAQLLAEVIRLRRQLRSVHDAQSILRDQALRDPLTGLLNRRGWDAQLALRVESPQSQPRPAAIAIVDVDQFKPLNDTHGHSVGDEALRQIAEALRGGVRPDDIVARLGGDEFGVYLAGIEPAHVAIVLDRLRRRAASTTTVSIGGVTIPAGDSRSWSAWLTLADAALIDAKRLGRDRIVVRTAC